MVGRRDRGGELAFTTTRRPRSLELVASRQRLLGGDHHVRAARSVPVRMSSFGSGWRRLRSRRCACAAKRVGKLLEIGWHNERKIEASGRAPTAK